MRVHETILGLLVATSAAVGSYFFLCRLTAHAEQPRQSRPLALMAVKKVEPPKDVVQVGDLPPAGMRKLLPGELTPSLVRKAGAVLGKGDKPIGTEVVVDDRGKTFVARFERHFHEVGGPKRPWGAHTGVTLYAME